MVALDSTFLLDLELDLARAELAATRDAARQLAGFAKAATDPAAAAGFQARADACARHLPIQEATVRDLEARLEAGR